MKLLSFSTFDTAPLIRLGALLGDTVIDLSSAGEWAQENRGWSSTHLPDNLMELLNLGPDAWQEARRLLHLLAGETPLELPMAGRHHVGYPLDQVSLHPPLPRPASLRDFYAFEAHVRSTFANRGREVPPERYQFPVFYYSNPNQVFGPAQLLPYPSYSQALDYELEIACVIGRAGKDIPAGEAPDHIFGYTILNDWSARDVQQAEMRAGLGPAKGKDFAASLGPWIVTPDELEERSTDRPGVYDLEMTARVNGEERSRGSWKNLYYSFGEMIARASAGVFLFPGDVIGSGTVGTGCLLELTRGKGPWLDPGDLVELEVERIGLLANQVGERPGSPG
ncbi:MAG TPA: fumarylacetoacetate hydrolase family protein [Anaerolineales bacterium]|nr:fumarylacetoacetate hydrolase family protein [Anaerolineales bacterium]